jgi:hypothetical protein
MCDNCQDANELQKMLYEEWRKQEGIPEGAMVSDTVQSTFLGNSDGVLILQKAYDRSYTSLEAGNIPMPDTQVNAVHVPADEIEDFIGEIIGAAGPQVLMRLLQNGMNLLNEMEAEDE